jgi:predicted Zn-dependent peptidase
MFFKGTKKRPTAADISSAIDGIGAEFNAFTSKEYTGYYIKASSNHIDLVLDMLSDMLLHSKFDQEEIDRERGVINEELRMYLDTPMRHIGDIYEELLYGDQPLGWDTVGSLETLKNINRDEFLEYLNKFYQSSNMLVSISGGVAQAKVNQLVDKYFGEVRNEKVEGFLPVKFKQNKPDVKLVHKQTEQAHLHLGVRSYPRGSEKKYALALLNSIMGSSMSSRLFIQLRERRGLAYYVRTSVDVYEDAGSFVAGAGVEPSKIEEAIKVILDEFRNISNTPLTESEMIKAKEYIKGKLVLELEDSREVSTMFGLQHLLEKKIETPKQYMERIDEVTGEQVQQVAKEIIENSRLNLAIIGPYKEEGRFRKILKL